MTTGPTRPSGKVTLRDVVPSDLPTLFEQQRDPEAIRMAAFGSRDPIDRDTYVRQSTAMLRDPNVVWKAVLLDDRPVGYVLLFRLFGVPAVAYELAREVWGRGIATRALAQFLKVVKVRPLYARAAQDNIASIRVLEKCGFTVRGEEKSFASARGRVIRELILCKEEL
jgi:RimJ/RimL family protein N-acetyltransferase